MNYTAFFSSLKEGRIEKCYLFDGTEEYIKQQALKRLEEKLLPPGLEDLNLTLQENPDAASFMAACDTMPFLGEKRLVVVKECASLLTTKKADNDDTAEAMAEYLADPSPDCCIVFYVKGKADSRKKLYKAILKHGVNVDFSPMSEGESAKWAIKTLKVQKKILSPAVADYLVFTVGKDASTLTQEMQKLISYTGDREEITKEDIDAICIRSLECNVFEMVDAQVSGNLPKALTFLNEMLRNGEEPFMIQALLLRQYRLLYHARRLGEEGVPSSQLAPLLGIPPFTVGRTQQQARSFSLEKLRQAYDYLMDLEYRLKQGLAPQNGCVETAMVYLQQLLHESKGE